MHQRPTMNPPRVSKFLGRLAHCLAAVGWLATAGGVAGAADRRPNVRFIAVDDLRPEAIASGSDLIKTPKAPQYVTPEALAIQAETGDSKGRPRKPVFEAADVPDDTYVDGKVARLAAATLEELKHRDEPYETTNLAERPEHADVVQRLSAHLPPRRRQTDPRE